MCCFLQGTLYMLGRICLLRREYQFVYCDSLSFDVYFLFYFFVFNRRHDYLLRRFAFGLDADGDLGEGCDDVSRVYVVGQSRVAS